MDFAASVSSSITLPRLVPPHLLSHVNSFNIDTATSMEIHFELCKFRVMLEEMTGVGSSDDRKICVLEQA